MKTWVMDTSVALAWYLREPWSPQARRVQERAMAGNLHLVVPTLHFWETANALRSYARRGVLDRATAADIYELHLGAPLEVIDPPRQLVLRVAFEYEATAYDAVFVALGLHLQIPVLTAERPTTPWVAKLGQGALRIDDAPA